VHFRDESIANGNGARLDTKRNEAATFVQRMSARVALRDRKLDEHDPGAAPRAFEDRENEIAPNAAVPENGRDVHAEERCLVFRFIARLE
jgi:hypothetical protein